MEDLKKLITSYNSGVVAFSGGTDSSLLLKIAYSILGSSVFAVTALSSLLPRDEQVEAKKIAEQIGVPHLLLPTDELSNDLFINNSRERCYYCKLWRYKKLLNLVAEKGLQVVMDGTNADDDLDFRPGIRAVEELGIKTPLRDVGLNKEEIRWLAKDFGLDNWQKPSTACLASRIPYGEVITREKLFIVEKAENYLKSLGLSQLRVRHYGKMARIEVEPELFTRIVNQSKHIVEYFRTLGYSNTTLDLEGFRSGNLNKV